MTVQLINTLFEMTKRPHEASTGILHLPRDLLSKIISLVLGYGPQLIYDGIVAMANAMAECGEKKLKVRAEYEYRVLSLLGDWWCVRLTCRFLYDDCSLILSDWEALMKFAIQCNWENRNYFMHSGCCLSRFSLFTWMNNGVTVPLGTLRLRALKQYDADEASRLYTFRLISEKLKI